MIKKIKQSQKLRSALALLIFFLFFVIMIGINSSSNINHNNNPTFETKDILTTITNNYHYNINLNINNDLYKIEGYKYNDLEKEIYYKNEKVIDNINDIIPYYNFVNLDNIKKITNDQFRLKSTNINEFIYIIPNNYINIVLLSSNTNQIKVELTGDKITIDLQLDNYFSEIYNKETYVEIKVIYDQIEEITENMMQ